MFGRGSNDDQLPGDDWAARRTTVPVTDKSGCYRPQTPGEATVDFCAEDLQGDPHSRH